MANELVRRFDATTAQRIAPAAELAIVGTPPMVIEIYPAVVNRFQRFFRRGLHAPQATEDCPHLAHVQTGHGCFDPLDGLHRGAIVGFGHPMEVLCTVVVIEYLTRLGKQRLDVFPYPLGSITDDAQAHLFFRNEAGLFELLEGLTELLFTLHLMPTEHMDDALTIKQVEAKPFRVTPLPPPPRPPRSLASAPVARCAGAVIDTLASSAIMRTYTSHLPTHVTFSALTALSL
jgi:hypothetical protein